jgi:hypothetical protein
MITLCFVLIAGAFAYTIPFPGGFDEAAHVSYIIHLVKNHSIMPDFYNFPLYYGNVIHSNYLTHPPLYYVIMKPFVKLLQPLSSHDLISLRIINITFTYFAVLLTLLIGFKTNWNRLCFSVFAILVVTVPNLSPIAGSISNDNLAILGGCLSIFGIHKILTQEEVSKALFLALFGFFLASSAKFTALLLTGIFLLTAFVYLCLTKRYHVFAHKSFKVGLILCLLSLIPYCIFLLQFGSPVPSTPGNLECIARTASERGWDDIRLSFSQYAIYFVHMMAANWPAFGRPYHPIILPGICLFVLSFMGLVLSARRCVLGTQSAIDIIIICGGVSFVVTILVHFVWAYINHTNTGWLADMHPRYYFPLLPIMPAACANAINSIRSRTFFHFAVTSVIFLSFSPILLNLLIL